MYAVICITLFILGVNAEINSHKCLEVSTFGYTYDALYRISARKTNNTSDGSSMISFYVKTPSDAHILMTNTPRTIEELGQNSFQSGSSNIVEIVIGAGKNSFSEIRVGDTYKKRKTIAVQTPGIVSADEFRGFWIALNADGSYAVGRAGNNTPILSATPGMRDMQATQVTFFGVSTWSHVKGTWKFNCENQTAVEKTEDIVYKGVKKLRRNMLSFYDNNIVPQGANGDPLVVTISLHVHHFTVKEKSCNIFMSGKVLLKWNDLKLKWDEKEYDNLTSFQAPAEQIWTPALQSVMSPLGGLQLDVDSSVSIENTGQITWTPSYHINIFCDFRVQDWPRDVYECEIPVGIDMTGYAQVASLLLLPAPDEHWETEKVFSDWEIMSFYKGADQYDKLQFLRMLILFTRKSAAYMTIFAAPFLASSLMILGSLWLRDDSPAKLHLRCLSMLVLTVFFIGMGDMMPAISSTVPTIVGLYMFGIMLACFSIIHYAIIKNTNTFTFSLPQWIQQLLIHPLFQNLYCLTRIDEVSKEEEHPLTKFWLLTGIFSERLLFIIYLIIYLILWIEIQLF